MILGDVSTLFDFENWGVLDWIAQAIGLLALFFFSFSFLQKSRKGILAFQLCGSACWVANMILINAVAGAVLNAISVIRAAIFLVGEKKSWANHWSWAPILSVAYAAGGVFSYFTGDGWTAILPSVALIIATFSFIIHDPFKIRLINFFCCPIWLTYQILHGNISGILNEIISMIVVLIGIISIDLIGRKRANAEAAENLDN